MSITNFILWNVNPEIPFINQLYPIRWYGLLFAIAFIVGQKILHGFFKKDNIDEKLLDSLTLYSVIGIVVGARLGHCLFYDFHYYFIENPLEILKIWQGGLASHGGGIGIVTALILFYRKNSTSFKSPMRILDRIALAIAIGGCFVRFGNLTNSEIIGKPSDAPWAFVFSKNSELQLEDYYDEIEDISIQKEGKDTVIQGMTHHQLQMKIDLNSAAFESSNEQETFIKKYVFGYLNGLPSADKHLLLTNTNPVILGDGSYLFTCYGIPRHPAQLYESMTCLILFMLMLLLFKKYNSNPPEGLPFGLFCTYIFILRFFYEFLKENQVAMEDALPINMGQILSIPLVVLGVFFIVRSLKQSK